MRAVFEKSVLSGTVKAPPSKSMAHRLVIAAALSGGHVKINGVEYSEDIKATLDCTEVLGARVSRGDDFVEIDGGGFLSCVRGPLDCHESGSTLRFFIPLAMLTGQTVELCGSRRLLERPLGVYEKLARERSGQLERVGDSILVSGRLDAGEYEIDGSVSSQFISGLLFALCRIGGGVIRVTPPFESRPYVEMTVGALSVFGAAIDFEGNELRVRSGIPCGPGRELTVEGDWSNAAFLDVYNLLGGSVTVTGLDENSAQGDRAYREHFRSIVGGTPTIDITDTPDLAPILFALAAAKNGAVFTGTRRLAAKESDRAAVMAHELSKFGARVEVGENTVKVMGGTLHAPVCPIERHNDHRVVMAASTLLTLTGGVLDGCEDVKKSFPSYFEKIRRLGASFTMEAGERNDTI